MFSRRKKPKRLSREQQISSKRRRRGAAPRGEGCNSDPIVYIPAFQLSDTNNSTTPEGRAWLASKAKEAGVIATGSGLLFVAFVTAPAFVILFCCWPLRRRMHEIPFFYCAFAGIKC
jgi:hypothetical protein